MKCLLKIMIILTLFLSGCVSVSYLPTDETRTYPSTDSLKVFWEKPDEPYIALGMLTAEDHGEEQLFAAIKKKAMSIGAHGIIMKSPKQQIRIYGYTSSRSGLLTSSSSHRLEAIAIRFNENNNEEPSKLRPHPNSL